MFRVLLILALLFLPAVAEASAYWKSIGNGYYLYYSHSGAHDGWYYRLHCGRYVKHSRVSDYKAGVSYSANWKSDLVKALEKAKDTELFLEAIRESGLKANAASLPAQYQSGYVSGSSTYYQGYGYTPYAAQGQSILGLASYAPNIGQVDIESLLRTQQRLAERQAENASQANNYLTDRIGQVGTLQAEVAKIQAAGAAIVASVQAASPPRIEQHTWSSGASGVTGGSGASGDGTANGETNGNALALVKAADVLASRCVSCHGPNKREGNLDLSNFAVWDDGMAEAYEGKIRDRIAHPDPSKRMPPADKPQLTAADMKKLLNVLPDAE